MTFYLRGLLVSLGGVALLYVTLYAVGIVRITHAIVKDVHEHAPLGGTAGGGSWHVEFLLWGLIVFAATFLIYLRVMSGRPLH